MKRKQKKAFTLIELLLYISLAGVIVFSLSSFLSISLAGRIKSQISSETEQQGQQIMQIITQTIRNADSINYPATTLASSTLSLAFVDITKNPTIFSLDNGIVNIKIGSASPLALNNSQITVKNLSFINLSKQNTGGNVQTIMTIKANNNNSSQEYQYEKTFITSSSLR